MKRIMMLLVFLLAMSSAFAAVERIIPVEAEQGETIMVFLEITEVAEGSGVVIGEFIPDGAVLESWSITGAREGPEGSTFTQEDRSLIWEFTTEATAARVEYTVVMPQDTLVAKFDAVYAIEPDEYGNRRDSLILSPVMLPVAEPPATVPVPVLPEPEQPAPVPAPTSTLPLLLALFTLLASGAGIALYLRTRVAQYKPGHVSFVDQFRRVLGAASLYTGLRLGLVLPKQSEVDGFTEHQESVLDHFPEEQRRMLEKIEEMQAGVQYADERSTLDALKQELLSIRFSYEDI